MNDRLLKVNELLLQELGKLFSRELEFPKNTIVTITKVEATPELKTAVVSINTIPDKNSVRVLLLLKKTAGHIQNELNHTLEMRFVPRISFKKSVKDSSERVEELFDILDHEA